MMIKKILIYILFFGVSYTCHAEEAPKTNLGINFNYTNIEDYEASFIKEKFLAKINSSKIYNVINRSENNYSKADQVIDIMIVKNANNTYLLSVKVVNAKTNVIIYHKTEQHKSFTSLESETDSTADYIIDKEYISKINKKSYYTKLVVPGWSQYYRNKKITGAVFFSSFLLSLAYVGKKHKDYYESKDEWKNEDDGSLWNPEADNAYDRMKKNQRDARLSWITMAFVYAVNTVYVLCDKPEFEPQTGKGISLNDYENKHLNFDFKHQYENSNALVFKTEIYISYKF